MAIVRLFRALGAYVGSLVMLFLRVYWGYQFFQMGWGKFGDMPGTIKLLESLSIPSAPLMAQVVAYVETIGGLCLVFGLLSRLAALALIVTMVGAYFTAHFEAVKVIMSHPAVFVDEKPFMFLLTTLLVFSYGAGYLSLDHYFMRRSGKKAAKDDE